MTKHFCILLAVVVLLLAAEGVAAKRQQAGVFDYFVLALSWSPSYCASHVDDVQQCAPGRHFAFVVHGLWPQYDQGWPQDCATSEAWVTQKNIDDMLAVMPSRKLIIHEWKKHGTCAGIPQADYFRATRMLFAKVKIPARYLSPTADILTSPGQLVTDFVKTNTALAADMISVQCGNASDRARLAELRICLDRRGNFASCGSNEKRQCKARQLILPRVR